jgi:hypothetical protein
MKRIPWLLLALCSLVALGIPHVHAQTSINPPPGNGWTQLASGLTTPTYVDSTCADGITCYYAVEAVDQFGTALDTTFITAAIPSTGTHTVTLTWNEATAGATFTVFQGPPPAAPAGLAAAVK